MSVFVCVRMGVKEETLKSVHSVSNLQVEKYQHFD